MNKRIIFGGTPDFAAVHLKAMLENGLRPEVVYTQPDRPSGRGHKLTPSPVKVLALEHGIEVRTPLNFKNEDDIKAFEELESDLFVVVAYGIILPERIINSPKMGCINLHGSLLPKYRGAAPIQRALLDGEEETGVTVMQIAKALDAGNIYLKETLLISKEDTSGSLFEKLSILGSKTLVKSIPLILDGKLEATPQDETLATYAAKLTKAESAINFNETADEIELKVRGLNPWPIATLTKDKTVYKVFKAKAIKVAGEAGKIIEHNKQGLVIACKQDALLVEQIQAPGHKCVNAADLIRSRPDLFSIGSFCD